LVLLRIWLRELDLNQRPSGYESEREMGIALKVKLYSGLKILTCKNTCKSCGSVSVSAVLPGYTTISHRNASLSAIAAFDPRQPSRGLSRWESWRFIELVKILRICALII
jgi:hypothetical protein